MAGPTSKPIVVFVADFPIYPAISGNRRRVASLIAAVRSWGYQVHYVALDVGFTAEERALTRSAVDDCLFFEWTADFDPWGKLAPRSLLGRIRRKLSRHAKQFVGAWPEPLDPDLEERCPGAFRRIVVERVGATRAVAVVVEYLWLSKCLEAIPGKTLKVLDSHDAMHLRLEQFRGSKLHSFFQCTLEDELKCFARADKTMMIQETEKQMFCEWFPTERLMLTPHAHSMVPPPRGKRRGKELIFIGAAHASNVEGLVWFISEVWPRVRAVHADATLTVVGNAGLAVERDRNLAAPLDGVTMRGIVESIVDECHRADISIAPIFRGSGLKVKVVEALCTGMPLVTTSKGVEGIVGVEKCEAVRIADTPAAFSAAVLEFLGSALDYSDVAISFAERHFSEDAAYGELKASLESASAAALHDTA